MAVISLVFSGTLLRREPRLSGIGAQSMLGLAPLRRSWVRRAVLPSPLLHDQRRRNSSAEKR
jgi:hypothetical protein